MTDVDPKLTTTRRPIVAPATSSAVSPLRLGASPIEMGPDLPIAVYFAMEPWLADRIRALALYCSDGRWGEAFDEFCHRHLRIPRYDRCAVPGGPGCIATPEEDSPVVCATRAHLDFLVKVHELERIVLITHFGCAWYGERLGQPPAECLPAQYQDVRTSAATLGKWYPGMRVEAYLAMRRQERVSFHQLDVGS